MLENCITSINQYSSPLILDSCHNTISYSVSENLDASTLVNMSNHCFNLYKDRLGDRSKSTFEIGSLEYETIHKTLIAVLSSYKPVNLSFSISSSNPSLHFIIRLPNEVSVFVETYINPEDENSTYLQVLNDEEPILQAGGSYSECLDQMEDTLSSIFPNVAKTYVEL